MDEWDDDDFFWRFRRTKAREVKGGIKAQAKKFGQQWWAEKWLEAIERFGPQKRVARGRSYARKGQALRLELKPGLISAAVQGSREEPYEIHIPLQQVAYTIQQEILQRLRTQPIFAASLLSGEVPPEIESLFNEFRIPLFPDRAEGRSASCSCPDESNPCKHIAAIYYLISLELERDPFLLLYLRGISRQQLAPKKQKLFAPAQTEPLPTVLQQFWKSPRVKQVALPDLILRGTSKPTILQRLGSFPFWRGEAEFMQTMETIYESARKFARARVESIKKDDAG